MTNGTTSSHTIDPKNTHSIITAVDYCTTVHCSTLQYSTVHNINTVQYNTVHNVLIQYIIFITHWRVLYGFYKGRACGQSPRVRSIFFIDLILKIKFFKSHKGRDSMREKRRLIMHVHVSYMYIQ